MTNGSRPTTYAIPGDSGLEPSGLRIADDRAGGWKAYTWGRVPTTPAPDVE